jgi:hypothetical protein
MTGTLLMPPATGINYSSWAMTGFIFQYWIRRRHFRVSVLLFMPFMLCSCVLQWWSRYNYILSAALDTGVAIGAIVIFFCLQYPNNGGFHLDWWGNTVHQRTLDGQGAAEFALKSGAQPPFGLTTVRIPAPWSKIILNFIIVELIMLYVKPLETPARLVLFFLCYHCFYSLQWPLRCSHLGV